MTDLSKFESLLEKHIPGLKPVKGEPLSRHTSFSIGGPASLLVRPQNMDELLKISELCLEENVQPVFLGSGTNVLAPDEGLNRLVILTRGVNTIKHLGNGLFRADCGATLARLAQTAAKEGYGGLEFAHGIPGSVGGGVLMNAGAYGGELKDVCVSVRWIKKDGEIVDVAVEEAHFSYRESRFSREGGLILSADFRLIPGNTEEIQARMNELAAKRRASQPLDMPSAGSTFKRPVGGYAAALIDEAGLKGFAVGGAQVSDKHAGFVVNTGGATCADVLELVEQIQKKVFETHGIRIEPEVRLLG
ncbi:MAG: UDP-N-acetylmuramate dehydrogenase [Ruminococcaceae bacterium]|nr:UDP-N-acetylmuramate dehydrogenase [Oscillospiraceae bacterium]